jgi:hypothetical protein
LTSGDQTFDYYTNVDEAGRTLFCFMTPAGVESPSLLGDFVYHCHILEDEDHGLMAKIRVLPKS